MSKLTHSWSKKGTRERTIKGHGIEALSELTYKNGIGWSIHQRKQDGWYVVKLLGKSFVAADVIKAMGNAVEYAVNAEKINVE